MEFYLTVMGRRFFESTMPKIADALERIADRLATAEHFAGTLEQVAPPSDATAARVAELEEALRECLTLAGHIDEPERDEALDKVRAVLEEKKAEEQKEKAEEESGVVDTEAVVNVRRGLRRGSALVRGLMGMQIVPGVHRIQSDDVLRHAAALLDNHAESYGSGR